MMKRLDRRYRKWLILRSQNEQRKRRERPFKQVSLRRDAARSAFLSIREALPSGKFDYKSRPGYCTIIAPENLNLIDNYDETLAFILDMRSLFHARHVPGPEKNQKLRVFSEFASIKKIEPSAGLVLAAEVDRWRLASGNQPRSHDKDWHPPVKHFFRQAGLFELLGIKQDDDSDDGAEITTETLRFVRGFSVRGEQGSRLRDRLEALCGKSIGPRTTVYEAIAEAIANTRHAYPSGQSIWPAKLAGRWWASGSWQRDANNVSIQLYDQGVGIPATLPRSEHWSDVLKRVELSRMLHPENRDDRLIEAALEIGRTSTGQHGRGKGLAEMTAWIDQHGSGFLRITSGRGNIVYRPGGTVVRTPRAAAFPGTLIEWEVSLDD